MRKSYRYRPYRGSRVRRRNRIINLLLAAAILAALVWVICLLLPLEEGGLRFPGQGEPAQSDEGQLPQEDDAPDTSAETPDSDPAGAAEPQETENDRQLLVSAAELAGDTDELLALYQSGRITGLAVTVKDETGVLYYPSAIAEVQGKSTILQPVSGFADAVKKLSDGGVPLAAVLYTHRDDKYARQYEDAALQNIDHIGWRNPEALLFLDPANEKATRYLTGIGRELAALGFDELILRGLGYPSYGRFDRIVYASDRYGAVTGLVTAMQTAASPAKVSVWLDTPETAVNEQTGQSVSALYAAADRVYAHLPTASAESAAAMPAQIASAAGESDKVVLVTEDAALAETLDNVLMDTARSALQ